jgi:hypothetical protein
VDAASQDRGLVKQWLLEFELLAEFSQERLRSNQLNFHVGGRIDKKWDERLASLSSKELNELLNLELENFLIEIGVTQVNREDFKLLSSINESVLELLHAYFFYKQLSILPKSMNKKIQGFIKHKQSTKDLREFYVSCSQVILLLLLAQLEKSYALEESNRFKMIFPDIGIVSRDKDVTDDKKALLEKLIKHEESLIRAYQKRTKTQVFGITLLKALKSDYSSLRRKLNRYKSELKREGRTNLILSRGYFVIGNAKTRFLMELDGRSMKLNIGNRSKSKLPETLKESKKITFQQISNMRKKIVAAVKDDESWKLYFKESLKRERI